MDQNVNHTNGIVRELEFGGESVAELATLLGPQYRLPRAGIIRPGIMVLKGGCPDSDKVLYEALVKEGASWDEIDAKLGQDKAGKSKLIPKNVDYFTIHPQDCRNPRDIEQIYKLYADEDGKLRSFPVIFPVNEWWNIIPHSLRCFGTNGLKFKSDFRYMRNETGSIVNVERICTFPLSAEPGKRIFGGRKWGERPCDPEVCTEYQKGECTFGGVIQFYIPGVKGIGVWVLPTTSWYSLSEIKTTLEMVSRLTGGKIAGTFNGKPIFRLKKVKEEVTRIDLNTGKPIKTTQYLIALDVDVDMTELASLYEAGRVLDRGTKIAGALSSPVVPEKPVSNPPQESSIPDTPPVNPDPENPGHEVHDKDGKNTTDTVNENENGSKETETTENGKKELKGEVQVLWKSISNLYRTNGERKKALKELTGKDSFFDLTEEEARKALERLANNVTNGY